MREKTYEVTLTLTTEIDGVNKYDAYQNLAEKIAIGSFDMADFDVLSFDLEE